MELFLLCFTTNDMRSFELDILDGHAIMHNNNDVILIDTGAPSTLHKNDTLDFMSVNYPVLTKFMGMTVGDLSVLLGKYVTTLPGIDVLKNYSILFDYKNRSVKFNYNETDKD
ncbi:MAG TPA: hypothetical protein PKA90_16475 [Ignavibacteria bacterium]|nr:hypothetical protein [Ignavibacteria bacterium]